MSDIFRGLRIYVHNPASVYDDSWNRGFYKGDCARLKEMGAVLVSDPRDGALTAIVVFTPDAPHQGYKYTLEHVREPDRPPAEWPLSPFLQRYRNVPILQRPWTYACMKAKRALLDDDNWGGWRMKISDTTLAERSTTRGSSPRRRDYQRTERYVPSDSPLVRMQRGRSPSPPPRNNHRAPRGRSPPPRRSRPRGRSYSPNPKQPTRDGNCSKEIPQDQENHRPSEHKPCEFRLSPSESPIDPAREPDLHHHNPNTHPLMKPRVLELPALGSRPARPTPRSSYLKTSDDAPCPGASTDTNTSPWAINNAFKWRPISKAGRPTAVTVQLNPRTSFEATASVDPPQPPRVAGSSASAADSAPQGSASNSPRPSSENTEREVNLIPAAPVDGLHSLEPQARATTPPYPVDTGPSIELSGPSPAHSVIDLTVSPQPSGTPSPSPISAEGTLQSGSSLPPAVSATTLSPIFILGPTKFQFHVLPSVSRSWIEQAITWGGGVLTVLEWAEFVVRPPDTPTRDVWDYEAVRHPGARLVRPEWVFESMVAATMLEPSDFELR